MWERRQVIDAIRAVATTRLYVACDGPNPERPGEAEKVAATRAVIEHAIVWPCLKVIRAIPRFFEQVEEGIIYVRQPTSY